jgi:NAD dependent epimerase/dehydratase
MTKSKVLITGADGFIGSHLTEALVRNGYEVKAFVQYNSFNSWGWLDECAADVRGMFEIFSGDIRDPHGVKEAVKGCDAIMHLAALIAIPFSYHSPDTYIDTNIKGTLNILQAAKECDIKRVIHTSTSEVYGTAQYVPINESHPIVGQSPYSASKIGADQLAHSFYSSFNLPVVTVRPFNTYGPRQSARAVIPTIITQLASNNYDLRLGATHPTRDFSFVLDTVSGFVKILNSDAGIGEVVNLGSGFEISIKETAELMASIMGVTINFISEDIRQRPKNSEVERLWADNSKARMIFGWEPKYAGIEGFREGLIQTIEWFRDKKNLSKYKVDIYNL